MTAQKANTKRKGKANRSAMTGRDKTNHGNSAFGHRQGDARTRTRGSQNNAYGQQNVALPHSGPNNGAADAPDLMGGERGNSAFGHRQGDPLTRTTGSQNNAYGKAQSAAAHAKHDRPNDDPSVVPSPSPND